MFSLKTLRFDDAMSLSAAILARHGIDISGWDHAKTANLEQLVSLMQFHPVALELSLTMKPPSTIDWDNHFQNVLTGQLVTVNTPVSMNGPDLPSALREIWSMYEAIRLPWQPWDVKKLTNLRYHDHGKVKESIMHLQYIYNVLCPGATCSPRQQQYIELFFDTLESQGFSRGMSMAIQGVEVDEAGFSYRSSMYNLFNALSICSNENVDISRFRWPEEAFLTGCSLCRIYSTAAEATYCAACFEKFVVNYIQYNGGLALPEDRRHAIFFISNQVTAMHRSEVPTMKNRGKELASYTVAMVEATEAKYGPIEDENVRLQQSVAYRYLAMELMEAGQEEQADLAWQKMLDIDKSIFESDDATPVLRDTMSRPPRTANPRMDWAVANFAITPEEAESIRQKMQSMKPSSNPLLSRWHDVRKILWPFLKAVEKAKGQNRDSNEELEVLWQKL